MTWAQNWDMFGITNGVIGTSAAGDGPTKLAADNVVDAVVVVVEDEVTLAVALAVEVVPDVFGSIKLAAVTVVDVAEPVAEDEVTLVAALAVEIVPDVFGSTK